jgi:hypothetical protein
VRAVSGYRVDPAAVQGITDRTRTNAAEVTAALQLLRSTVAEAQAALPTQSGAETCAALAAVLADPLEVELQATVDHIRSAADHVDQSVRFFDEGDQQIAADIRRDQG